MLEHWLWLAHRPGISDHTKLMLLQQFETPEAVFAASDYPLARDLSPEGREALEDKNLTPSREIVSQCEREKIRILTWSEPEYPNRLKNIYDPPLILYYKGALPKFDSLPAIAIVGTRKASAYGISAAQRIGAQIGRCGGLVVSGLAMGVDAAAMNGALSVGCPVVGVLGCGVDVVYPRANRSLFESVEQYGCILSEFMPGAEPVKWRFPRRNRIISGLSCGVVVVEAPTKSGALITARCALDQGRDVFVVPGNIDLPTFAGSNQLLREGAGPISSGWDVMSEYQSLYPDKIRRDDRPLPEVRKELSAPAERKVAQKPCIPRKKPGVEGPEEKKDIDNGRAAPYIDRKRELPKLSDSEQAIVNCLQGGQRLVDDVIAETDLPAGQVLCALTMLELKKIIVRHPGRLVSLKER